MESKVWYITGASKGLGLALIKKLLAEGHRVAATSRDLPALIEAIAADLPTLTEAVAAPEDNSFLPLQVDLADERSVADSLQTTHDTFGRIDVVVNNAGYSLSGDVSSTINVIQKVMPYLHQQSAGHIINITGIPGPGAMPREAHLDETRQSSLDETRQAIIGLSRVLDQDTRPLGIRVTAVAPGAFRTQYQSQDCPGQTNGTQLLSIDGKQPGDPTKAAAALLQLVAAPEPPTLLFLDSDAYKKASAKMVELEKEIERWKQLSLSPQFAD
jgi:NAD(P)-dependent dehydrogenase (short-subunit alcohol dehydrogenase family)